MHFVLVYVCVCVVKNTLVSVYSPMKTFLVLTILTRVDNPWLSKATCLCKSNLWHCGRVTQPPSPNVKAMFKVLDYKVSVFLEAFCDVPINC